MTYTIKLNDGKYTVISGAHEGNCLDFLRYGEPWPAADDLRFCGVVQAMAQRIEELETAMRDVLQGSRDAFGWRRQDGIVANLEYLGGLGEPWESHLRTTLEQKP